MIQIPNHYNYVGVFLTLGCNLTCSYCINHLSGPAAKKKMLKGTDWVESLNRLQLRPGLPLTLQGGEPTLHPHIYEIINGLRPDIEIDLLTNLQFDPDQFSEKISPSRLQRDAKYASIRASFHPETMSWKNTFEKAKRLKEKGYSISLNSVAHPDSLAAIEIAKADCATADLDFRTKDFMGIHQDKIYGNFKYENSCFQSVGKSCQCKTSELLIDPNGQTYRCHHDLYNSLNSVGRITDADFKIVDEYRPCQQFGKCNPCDVKVKTNRYQEFGHTSVDIIF